MTATDSWTELVSTALVGTDRRPLPPDPADPPGAEPAQALLRRALRASVPALTGARPAHHAGPPPEPAPADDRALIPAAAQLRLRAVLDVWPRYLPEWLAVVRASGRRVPSAALPALLDAGRSNITVRADLAEVLGPRGHWLARQNPDWRYLLREPIGPLRPQDWDGTDTDAALAYANGLYAADPAAARALFAAAWPGLTAATKLSLLALMGRHGTAAELPFVRGLAQDPSKQVREEAKNLEARFSGQEQSPELSPELFLAEVERLTAAESFGNELYRFAVRHSRHRWPLEGSRAILAALTRHSRSPNSPSWAVQQILALLADHAPLDLRPDAERAVVDQAADIAGGVPHQLDFSDLLTPLGFRADMHAELTASADADPGQE